MDRTSGRRRIEEEEEEDENAGAVAGVFRTLFLIGYLKAR